jgi:hypothetical protein
MVIEKNEDPMKANSIQLHFSFLSKQIKGFITEKVVREVFSQFGIVVDVVIKRYTRVPVRPFRFHLDVNSCLISIDHRDNHAKQDMALSMLIIKRLVNELLTI